MKSSRSNAPRASRSDGARVTFDTHTLRRPPEPEPDVKPKRPWLKPALGLAVLCGAIFWLGGFASPVAESLRDGLEQRLAAAGFLYTVLDVRGAGRTSALDIEDRLGAPAGSLIFDIDPAKARAEVEALDWVRHAAVMRLLPNRIVVVVEERRPVAMWRAKDGAPAQLVDDGGAVIAGADAASYRGLPMVVGEGAAQAAPELAAALVDFPNVRRLAARFERVGARRWDVRLRSGGVIKLPQAPTAAAFARFTALQQDSPLLRQPLAVIDLRTRDLVLRDPRATARPGVFERDA